MVGYSVKKGVKGKFLGVPEKRGVGFLINYIPLLIVGLLLMDPDYVFRRLGVNRGSCEIFSVFLQITDKLNRDLLAVIKSTF